MQTKITTMADLTTDLSLVYGQLRDRLIPINEAKELANVAGKLIKSAAEQLKYQEYIDDKTAITFFKNEPLTAIKSSKLKK